MYFVTSAISGVFGLIFLIVWLLLIIYTLPNILRKANLNVAIKVLWIAIIFVVPIVGAVIYLFWKNVKQF